MKTSSPEFRQMHRKRIIKTKTWLKTKGSVTTESIAISKMNALKVSPGVHKLIKEMNFLMKQQKDIHNTISYMRYKKVKKPDKVI